MTVETKKIYLSGVTKQSYFVTWQHWTRITLFRGFFPGISCEMIRWLSPRHWRAIDRLSIRSIGRWFNKCRLWSLNRRRLRCFAFRMLLSDNIAEDARPTRRIRYLAWTSRTDYADYSPDRVFSAISISLFSSLHFLLVLFLWGIDEAGFSPHAKHLSSNRIVSPIRLFTPQKFFWGEEGKGWCDVDPPTNSSYFWGLLPLCHFLWKSIKKCDRESADRQTNTQTGFIIYPVLYAIATGQIIKQ